MTPTRRLLLAAAAALPLALAACDNKCPTTSGRIETGIASTACTGSAAVQAGQTVTVRLHVCQTCKESFDSCTVTLPDASAPTTIQLDPLVSFCEDSSSCPGGTDRCGLVSCTFVAPATPNTYTLLVTGSNGNFTPTMEVVDTGGQVSCTPPI